SQTLPRPADVAAWIPVPLSDLLQSMTAKSVGERLSSYQTLIEKLEAIRRRIDETRPLQAPLAYAAQSGGAEKESTLPVRLILMVAGGLVVVVLLIWLLFVG